VDKAKKRSTRQKIWFVVLMFLLIAAVSASIVFFVIAISR
jgi:hypothetical protein